MAGAKTNGGAPIPASERSALLDSLRGLALAGILVANMVAFIGFGIVEDINRDALPLGRFNDLSEFLIEWLVVGKFYSIFSLLFGIGFAIQLGRLEQRCEGVARYLRRLAVLFVIGLAHMFLLWEGDIVALYALMGLVLLIVRKANDRALLWGALICWLIPIAWAAAIHFGGMRPAKPIFDHGIAILRSMNIDIMSAPLKLYGSGDIALHLRANQGEIFFRIADLVYQMRFTKVLGMFLIGLWIGRHAIFSRLDQYRPLLRRTAIFGLGLGLPLAAVKAVLTMLAGDDRTLRFWAELFYVLSTPTLALGYAAGFALLWRAGKRGLLKWTAPAGRMALTNYLMQTAIQSAIFFGWGLGLIATLGLAFVFPLTAAIFAFQVVYSHQWLSRYRLGPVEWVWRSLTYGKRQPMRREAEPAA